LAGVLAKTGGGEKRVFDRVWWVFSELGDWAFAELKIKSYDFFRGCVSCVHRMLAHRFQEMAFEMKATEKAHGRTGGRGNWEWCPCRAVLAAVTVLLSLTMSMASAALPKITHEEVIGLMSLGWLMDFVLRLAINSTLRVEQKTERG
jgi:hypothetical protein